MEPQLKQRLVGAAVLVALAVIFLPMLVKGPAPDSGVSDLSLTMPDAPEGEYATRDLPLVEPQPASPGALDEQALPTVDTADPSPASRPIPLGADPAVAGSGLPEPIAASPRLPASVAGGDYAVGFGAYSSATNAQAVVARLRESRLPAYRESTTVDGKPAWRVRIGPYATRADAEAARVLAELIPNDVDARVVALDAGATRPTPQPGPPAAAGSPADTVAVPEPVAAKAPAAKPAAAADVGFAVQVGAFRNAADATALRDRIRGAGFNAFTEAVQTDQGALTRVKAGPVLGRGDADQLRSQLKSRLGLDGIVRSHP
ncbi:SPOR domain-containing protein [Luteimonas vadosa]|uniref:SPOR domain-containing protein n=1 Tax=Luteimonas vadosa TaxID=1165507 RepID=A0ABP9E8K8_9GAMM